MNPDNTEPCFVVLRTDPTGITVKLVVWSREEADRQIDRLNSLNEPRNRLYYWVLSRALRDPRVTISTVTDDDQ